MQQKVWAFPLPEGTKVVVKFQSGDGAEYYAGSVLKWSQRLRKYFIKASDGQTYPAVSPNVKPFDTNDPQGLLDWLAVAQQGPEVAVLPASAQDLKIMKEEEG